MDCVYSSSLIPGVEKIVFSIASVAMVQYIAGIIKNTLTGGTWYG